MSGISSSQTLIINYKITIFTWTNLQISRKSFILPDFHKGINWSIVKCSFAMLNFMFDLVHGLFVCDIPHIIYEFYMVWVYLVDGLVINSCSGNIKGRHKNTNKNGCNASRSCCSDEPVTIWHCCIYKSLRISKTCKLTSTTNSYTKDLTAGTTI